jgi:hypothetical protein
MKNVSPLLRRRPPELLLNLTTVLLDPHALLQQVPLTVSPYLSLPNPTPLPYTYKSLSSTVPLSVTDAPSPHSSQDDSNQAKAAYVTSAATGHSAHPDAIIESCRALQDHLAKLQQDAQQLLAKWQGDIQRRDLAEKRRVAPGWLDVGESARMLVPERMAGGDPAAVEVPAFGSAATSPTMQATAQDGGAELDRAFGGLNMR